MDQSLAKWIIQVSSKTSQVHASIRLTRTNNARFNSHYLAWLEIS